MRKSTFITLMSLSLFLMGCNPQQINLKKLEKTFALPLVTTTVTPELFAVTNQSNVVINPWVSGEEVAYSIAPALPAGLVLDADTGIISGTPTGTYEDQTYTITATNPAGAVNYDIMLTGLDGYIVNSNADAADANTGDGICETATPGECTLRAAIDQIKFDTGRKMALLEADSYVLTSSLLSDAAAADIVVVGMGRNSTSINSANDAAIQILPSAGTITFKNLSIDNFGDGATGPANVIYATSNINFINVDIEDNYSTGGAIIQVDTGGNADLNGVYIYNNTSVGRGIIYNYNNGVMTIDKTTWYQNTGQYGGCLESQNSSSTTIDNSTCFGNTTNFAEKAAINVGTCGCATTATIKNTLIADNVNLIVGEAGGIRLGRNAGNGFNVNFVNNILTNNEDGAAAINDCYVDDNGTINDLGSNLASAASCGGANVGVAFTFSTDPMLTDTVPSDNGGAVPTISISPSSPAIDAGVNGSCAAYDQRGFLRPVDYLSGGAICDIGPLELQL